MHMIDSAQAAIQNPEVIGLVKQLSQYGLAVFVPHEHDQNEGFIPLAANRVQYEANRTVRFVEHDDPALGESIPTGWRWNNSAMEVIAACKVPHW